LKGNITLVLTDDQLNTLHANAHALRNVIRNIEVTALEFPFLPIDGVRSRPGGKEADGMQAALDVLPELKADLQRMILTVVAEKLDRDPVKLTGKWRLLGKRTTP
jgi:hypothetical protein